MPVFTSFVRLLPWVIMYLRVLSLIFFVVSPVVVLFAADPAQTPYTPNVKPASDEPLKAMKRIRLPEGWKIDVWAAEPLLANPVIFTIDHKGRAFVAETFRLHKGVTDIRGYLNPKSKNYWLEDDLACRTVEDRIALMRRHLSKKKQQEWSQHHERIRLIEDTTGDGKADKATVYADGFKNIEDGIAAGLLVRGKDVYYTCIPDLWLLRDNKGTGKADERKRLSSGYGVHIGYIGHDLHGLVMGPDGKIYFSIGDRGLNVKTPDGRLFYPDTGCVLRCDPDGSNLEVFASGLRNPQELAFDQYGNLFTGDNNSDGGDRARWVYIVEGGDCGWRIGYQFSGAQSNRGPWNAEKLWHPPHPGQPAWIIPPIINIADGPSGLVYYPGVGLPDRYKEHFFLSDFRGGPANSGIRSFAVKPKGAGFELTDAHQPVWGVLATDVDFGPDCAMYISDWVEGWGLTGKGRIWKITDPKTSNTNETLQVKAILGEGMEKRSVADTAKLLEHRDMRVRQEAQFSLAKRKKAGYETLAEVVKSSKNQLARIHAVWGLGQLVRENPDAGKAVARYLADPDVEIRAQAAKVVGERKVGIASEALTKLLTDESPRVQFFAAQALGQVGTKDSFTAVVKLISTNADRDLYVRHAAVQALVKCGDDKSLAQASRDPSASVRRAVLLAYRRMKSPEVATFLNDADQELVAEAARAINDVPIEEAQPKLAALIDRRGMSESLGYRVLNAAFRLGTTEHANAVARFASRTDVSVDMRLEALRMLEKWENPPGRDRIMGIWRPLPERKGAGYPKAAAVLEPALGAIFAAGPDRIRQEATRVAGVLGIKQIGNKLMEVVSKPAEYSDQVRAESLRALASLKFPKLNEVLQSALKDGSPLVRAESRYVLAMTRAANAVRELEIALSLGTQLEEQRAFDALGLLKDDKAEKLLSKSLNALLEGKIAPEARLDLIEAAERNGAPALKALLKKYESSRPKGEPFGKWRDSLVGGDVEAGRQIFLNRSEVSCLRCHKTEGQGAGEVGPDLTGVGTRQKRDYLLEAIVYPNKQIAKGYETVDVVLTNGQVRSGILKGEDAKNIKLMTAEGATLTIAKAKIEERKTGKSAMPEDLTKHLTRKDVRDLVAYLASLKEKKK